MTKNAIDHGAAKFIFVTNPSHCFRRPPNPRPSLMINAPEEAIPFALAEKEENIIATVRIGKQLAEDLMTTSWKTLK